MAINDALEAATTAPETGAEAPEGLGGGAPTENPSATDVSETPQGGDGASTPAAPTLQDVLDRLEALTPKGDGESAGESSGTNHPEAAGPVTEVVGKIVSDYEAIVAREKAAFEAIGYKDPETGEPLAYAASETERFLVDSLKRLAEQVDSVLAPLQSANEAQVMAQQANYIRGLVDQAASQIEMAPEAVGSYVTKYGPAWQSAMAAIGRVPKTLGELTAQHVREIVEFGKHIEGAGPSTATAKPGKDGGGKPVPAPVTRGGSPGGRTSEQAEDDAIRRDLGLT